VTGEYQNVTREIIAIVYDVEAVRDQMITILDKDNEGKGNPAGGNPPPGGPKDTDGDGVADDDDPDDDNDGIPDAEDPNPLVKGNGDSANDSKKNDSGPSQEKPRVVYWWEN